MANLEQENIEKNQLENEETNSEETPIEEIDQTVSETIVELEEKVEESVDIEEVAQEKESAVTIDESTAELDNEEAESTETEDDSETYYKEILEKASEFVKEKDWAFVSNELANLALHIADGPSSASKSTKSFIAQFQTLRDEFEDKKRAHYEELNKRKAENLDAKKELLKQFNTIISEEKWSATQEVSSIRRKWEHIKVLPHNEVEALNEKFEVLLAEFESHKVDRLVKKLQKEEENFTLKLLLLEKMDSVNAKITDVKVDYEELNKEINDLLNQWKKVGRVPAEKNQQVWDHFNKAQDTFNELRLKHDKEYRKSVEKSLEKKKKLIKEAEALMDENDIAIAARRVNKLHNLWKKTGNLPQKEENELWDKFKAATDAFNDKKSENIDVLRDQEQENYELKLGLIQRAVDAQDTESYDEGHQLMQKLMEEWKKIGPVPRKKSSKIWKQFKEAMDVFYENRRDHFKDVRKDQKQNLVKKNEIIASLKELGESADPTLAVEEAKKLQAEFKDAGHVPLKFKNKIWKEYREVCDVIYNRYRASSSDIGMERKLASEGVEPSDRKEIINYQKEVENLKKDITKIEAEIIQFQEAKTYFKPTNKGNKLIEELQGKIEKAEKTLDTMKSKSSELKRKIRELKSTEDDN